MGLPVKNLRDGTIKVQVANDGGGNPGEVEVKLDEGNLSWTESRPVGMISDRGTLDHARRGDEQVIELTFSMMYQTHLDPNSATPTVYEALTRQGAASAWVSQTFDSDDYAVNLEFTVVDPAGGTDEVINFDQFNVTNEDFVEGAEFDTLTITGVAPLWWVDFWWKAEDSINPRIGQHGTFTRASTATFINSDGVVDYARSGEFRSRHFPSAAAGRTGLLEAQRTNHATMSETLEGADWAATNVNVGTDDNVGPDGFTTAETLTASAGNGTLIQDLGVIGAAAVSFSIWLKRKTGTGDIDLTVDGGAGWTTVAVTSTWTRFEITQGLADPDFGIRIVTNADAVYAWGAQLERLGLFLSSYIPTTVYPLSPDGYLEFSGSAGNYASTPDTADVSITTAIDLRLRIAADDYTPAAIENLLAKWTEAGDKRDYRLRMLTDGKLSLSWSTDGAVGTVVTVDSSVALSTTDGAITWVRATMNEADGKVNFYTSVDGDNWTLLGAADQGGAGATSINDGIALLEIGAQDVGTANNFAGKVYRAMVFDGIAGTLVFDADPQDVSTHGVTRITLTEKENSAVVTTFSTSALATRVNDLLFFPLPRSVEVPQEATAYAAFVEKGTFLGGNSTGVYYVGSAVSGIDPRWTVDVDSEKYQATFDNGTDVQTAQLGAGPSFDDVVELRTSLAVSGAIVLGQSLNGAAETTATDATAAALPAAWADERLYLNSKGTSGNGFNAFREFIIARRTRTLNDLRKIG